MVIGGNIQYAIYRRPCMSIRWMFLVWENVWWSGSVEVKGRGCEEVPDHRCSSGLKAQEGRHEPVYLQKKAIWWYKSHIHLVTVLMWCRCLMLVKCLYFEFALRCWISFNKIILLTYYYNNKVKSSNRYNSNNSNHTLGLP